MKSGIESDHNIFLIETRHISGTTNNNATETKLQQKG